MYDFDEEESGEYATGADEVIQNLEDGAPADQTYSEEEYAADAMSQAMQKIEEANLFKTLINQDIFAPNSARPEILESVNGKIRRFAMKQLEMSLGLRAEENAQPMVSSPFDDAEVHTLKLLSTFTEVEMKILRMLISSVLKKDPVLAAQQTQATMSERKPELNQIQAPAPAIKPIQTQQPQPKRQAKTQQVRPTPQAATPAVPGQKRKRQKPGMATPNAQTKVKKMPTAEQLIPVMGTPGVVASRVKQGAAGVSEDVMQRGVMSVGDVVQRLTGGNILAVDDSNPADAAMDGGGVDVNGRF